VIGCVIYGETAVDAFCDSSAVRIVVNGCEYICHPRAMELPIKIGQKTIPLLRGVGPVWQDKDSELNAGVDCVRFVEMKQQDGMSSFYYEASGDVKWSVTLRKGSDGDVIFDLRSKQNGFRKGFIRFPYLSGHMSAGKGKG
jgi:hypothetical protein